MSVPEGIKRALKVVGLLNFGGYVLTGVTRSHKLSDPCAILSQALAILYNYQQTIANTNDSSLDYTRSNVLTLMGLAWSSRLGLFLLRRILKLGEDKRLNFIFKEKGLSYFKNLTFFWFMNAMWALSNICPIIMVQEYAVSQKNKLNKNEKFDIYDIILSILWFILFIMEAVADSQKYNFKNDIKNKDKFMNKGLWKYCRYPNYFAEIGMWSLIFLLSIKELPKYQWWVITSPLITFILLRFISGIPLAEKSHQKNLGQNIQYQNYVRNTNLLIPWFPKE